MFLSNRFQICKVLLAAQSSFARDEPVASQIANIQVPKFSHHTARSGLRPGKSRKRGEQAYPDWRKPKLNDFAFMLKISCSQPDRPESKLKKRPNSPN